MVVLAKYNGKAIIYRPGEKQMFVVAKTAAEVGEHIDHYDGGTNFYTKDLAEAFRKLYGIQYKINVALDILDNAALEDFGYFKCSECGDVLPVEFRCDEHFDKDDNVCVFCCDECQKNELIDELIDIAKEGK